MANTDTKNTKTIQSLRGMKDIVNEESSLFTYFVENASKIAKNYGFAIDPKCSEEENREKICDYLSHQGHYIGQTQENIVYRQF